MSSKVIMKAINKTIVSALRVCRCFKIKIVVPVIPIRNPLLLFAKIKEKVRKTAKNKTAKNKTMKLVLGGI